MASIKRDIASGLIVVGPLAVSLLALQFLIRMIAGFPAVAAIEPSYLRAPIALGVFIIVTISFGYLMRTTTGRWVEGLIDAGINRVPGLRVFYNAVRLGVTTVVSPGGGKIQPVRIEAWKGLRLTAFSTGHQTDDGRLICFLPTAPNITSGYVIEVDTDDATPTGETLERALTRIISAGFGEQDDAVGDLPPIHGGRPVGRARAVIDPD